MPALLTSMSRRPNVSSAIAIMSAIDSAFDISAGEIANLDSELGHDSGLGLRDIFWLAETVEHDRRAGCCECMGNTGPDTAGRSCYERYATFQGPGALFKAKRRLDIHGLVLFVARSRDALLLAQICTEQGLAGNAGWLKKR